jgi:hypothetical protein
MSNKISVVEAEPAEVGRREVLGGEGGGLGRDDLVVFLFDYIPVVIHSQTPFTKRPGPKLRLLLRTLVHKHSQAV